GMGIGGPGDPDKTGDGGGVYDPLGARPDRERNKMPTGEAVGIDHGEGDRGSGGSSFSVEGSINARINPGSNRDTDYETREEGPNMMWQKMHYGIDRPETGQSDAQVQGQTRVQGGAAMIDGARDAAMEGEELADVEEPPPGMGR
ncbi:MAG TPA: hypothetical protein PLU41_16530, partial [Acidobacteriota bacterium]|nr:hypothetical protein [Acidobacteriota bacterium]